LDNPQPTKIALFGATVSIGIAAGFYPGLFGLPKQAMATELVSLSQTKDFFVTLMRLYTTFNTHFI